jgi:predicted aldo/keto reductase-like oxidoreductase
MKLTRINRRHFITKASTGIIGAGAGASFMHKNLSGPGDQPGPDEAGKIKGYRTLGRTGFKVSDIGCGPVNLSNDQVLKAILDAGVNIIDTADYYGSGNNERMVGRVIRDFERKTLFVNTKISVSEQDTAGDVVSNVRKSLERLETDYLDGVMLWNVNSISEVSNNAFHQAIEQLKSEGRVKFSGITSHGANWTGETKDSMSRVILAAVEDGRFDMVMFVYNYLQQEVGEEILRACATKNIGTTLMKTDPFGGHVMRVLEAAENYHRDSMPDWLVKPYHKIIDNQAKAESYLNEEQILDEDARREAALGFVLNDPVVHTALISFRTFNDIQKYISLSGKRLSARSQKLINSLTAVFSHLYCRHACGICESKCPHAVPVNTIMRYHHYFMAQGLEKSSMQKYHDLPGTKADLCSSCKGYCETECPYGVSAQALLCIAHQHLSFSTV